MANTLDDLMPKILARGLMRLRGRLVMPTLVNRDYDQAPAERGQTVNVPTPPSIDTREVSPSVTPPAAPGHEQTTVPISLDQWHEAPIYFTDKDRVEVIDEANAQAIDAAADALAEQVNGSVFDRYWELYEFVGTAGTTPFDSNYGTATEARKVLNRNKSPLADRRMVIDPDAEENAINLSEFADSSFTSQNNVILEGDIGRKLGFDWVMDQQVPEHAAGDVNDGEVDGSHSAGVEEVAISSANGGTYNQGDVISFAGHEQTYTVLEEVSITATETETVKISPALQEDVANDAAVSVESDHTVNIAMHRDAFALAVRTFRQPASQAQVMTMVDDITGLPLRLEVTRQNKQDYWSFDLLWGVKVIRPELGVRVAG